MSGKRHSDNRHQLCISATGQAHEPQSQRGGGTCEGTGWQVGKGQAMSLLDGSWYSSPTYHINPHLGPL